MIVRERRDEFVLITQHDHARLSGEIAERLNKEIYLNRNREAVIFAAYEHDRGWIPLDRRCRSNEETRTPYTFMDYPLVEKLQSYRRGIDEMEEKNAYAALLASLHFVSFFHLESAPEESVPFVQGEQTRQRSIMERLEEADHACVARHLEILQFCDLFSLYVCLNEPGSTQEEVHPWYRGGIRFLGETSAVRWVDAMKIAVDRLPFEDTFQSGISYTTVTKRSIREGGFDQDLSDAVWTMQPVEFWKD